MQNFFLSIGKGLAIAAISVLNFFGAHYILEAPSAPSIVQQAPVLGAYNPSGGGTYRLSGSIGTTNTSITLSSFKEPVSNVPYTMAYLNSDIAYGTLDPQTNVSEFISFTGISQNDNGSATLSGVTRGLNRTNVGDSCTASTTFKQAHSGQSIFILSNSPCLYSEYVTKRNAETISGTKTFASTSAPKYDFNPNFDSLASTTLASIGYVASTSFAGTVNASETVKGISELSLRSEASAGTSVGGTGARLVLPASIATSTCQTATSSVLVASSTTGKLNNTCFDSTYPYTFSGANTFSANNSFTANNAFTATTTFASTTFNGQVQFNASTSLAQMATETIALNVTASTVSTSTGFSLTTTHTNQPVLVTYTGSAVKSGDGTSTWSTQLLIDGVSVQSFAVGAVLNSTVTYYFGGSIAYATSTLSVGSHTIQYRTTNGPVGTISGNVAGIGLTLK